MSLPTKSNEKILLNNGSGSSYQTSAQKQWKSLIFGLYYKITPFPEVTSSATKITSIIIFVVGFLPLLFRTIFLLGKLGETTLFSLNWAYTFPLAVLSMHSIVSFVTLFMLALSNFYNEFTKKYTKIIHNEVPKGTPHIAAHVILGIFMAFFITAQLFFVYENSQTFDHYVTDVTNSSATFRNSILGPADIYRLDTIVVLWATFVSALALIIYNLVADTVVKACEKLNLELKKTAESGELDNPESLNRYGNQQLQLLELASFGFSYFGILATFTFIAGFVTHVLIAFVTRSFIEDILPLTKIFSFMFMALGLFMLLVGVKRTSDFANELSKTSNIILFEPTIFSDGNEKLSLIATNIVFRIEHSHYLPKVFSSFKINEKFFQRAFLLIPFIIEYLNAFKKEIP
uniref:Gustatory receptor n=1 Tax=Panagrolaimus sp. PS1159 TaxID=55785 RepID=A0AC35GRV4_9BILA